MFCKNCGVEIADGSTFCPTCGASQGAASNQTIVNVNQPAVVDNGGFLWGLLGCCIPLVGLILFLVWKDTKPKTAKAAGIGALIAAGSSLLIYVIMAIAGIGLASTGFNSFY